MACDGTLHEIPAPDLPVNEPLPVPVTTEADDDLITGVYKGVFVNADYFGDFNISVTDAGTAAILNVRVNGKVATVTGVVSDEYYVSEGYLELTFPFTLLDTDFEFRALLYDDTTIGVGVALDGFRSDILTSALKDRTTARVNTWTGLYSGTGTAAGSQAGSTMYGTWETTIDAAAASGNWSVSKTM